jgi:hypothetical protein
MITTLHLWQLIRNAPASVEFRKLLHLDQREKATFKSQLLTTLAHLLVLSLMGLMLPATISFSCVEKALQIANAIANQHRSNRHHVLAVTPMGDVGLVLGIAQVYCRSITLSWGSLLKVCGVVALGLLLMFLIYGLDLGRSISNTLSLSLIVAAFFIDYMQSIAWAVVVGIESGLTGDPFKARTFAFAGYLSLQVIIYVGLAAALLLILLRSLASRSAEESPFLLFTSFAIFFTVRETAIALLWRICRQRINDDIPPLKLKNKQTL